MKCNEDIAEISAEGIGSISTELYEGIFKAVVDKKSLRKCLSRDLIPETLTKK